MFLQRFFREPELRSDQLNAENQLTDRKILGRDRIKFGIGCIMYQSEESGLTPIHTLLVRLLGGSHVHLGLVAGAGSVGSLIQWFGAVLLRKYGSNKKSMNIALSGGILFSLVLALSLLLFQLNPAWQMICLAVYIVGAFGLAGASGVQMNVESSWIGDLVPVSMRGWFTSIKWVIASLGVLFFLLVFGKLADMSKSPATFAGIFLLVAFSHFLAILLMSSVTDRKAQSAKFIASEQQKDERINYRSMPLWCYIWFYLTWAGGRTAQMAFSTAYLLDYFGYGMAKIAMLTGIQAVINLVMLLVLGKLSDRFGTRRPLLIVSAVIACSMLLWASSAWWGIVPIIIYQIISGAAGNTHSMLGINYGLEIFPSKGRAAYIGFSRVFIGISALAASIGAGFIMKMLGNWETVLWGAKLNGYHLFFTGCALFTMSCVLPLLLAGRRKVENI